MEEELDLRQYIAVFIKYKYWIISLTIIAMLVAFGVSVTLPVTYTAKSLVIITTPRYQMQFDSRFEPTNRQDPYKIYPELAVSDLLLNQIIDDLAEKSSGEIKLTTKILLKKLKVTIGTDPALIKLNVVDTNPEQAAAIVNSWADLFVTYVNDIYSSSVKDVSFFETKLKEVENNLNTAQQELASFQARNQSNILEAQFNSRQAGLVKYLAIRESLKLVIDDSKNMKIRLSKRPQDDNILQSDELLFLFLETNLFSSGKTLPIQLQIGDTVSSTNQTVAEQITLLDNLIANVQTRQSEIEISIAEYQPKILQLQEKLQLMKNKEETLQTNLSFHKDVYLSLLNKMEEIQIAAQDTNLNYVQVASHSLVPATSIGSRLLIILMAGMLGFLVTVLWAFFTEWWQQGKKT